MTDEDDGDDADVPEPDWDDLTDPGTDQSDVDPTPDVPENGTTTPSHDADSSASDGTADRLESGPAGNSDGSGSGNDAGGGTGDDSTREGPMGDLAADIDRRREEGSDLDAEELFDQKDIDGVDREALWRQVAGEDAVSAVDVVEAESAGDTRGVESDDGPTVEGPDVERETAATPVERVVEKRKYCQGCEYFSTPPDVRCTHEGTRIVEQVDMEHFRVVDCPIVAEDEELENV